MTTRGVSPVIETVLMAAAIVIFMVYLMGAFGDFVERVSHERARNALVIDSHKVAHAILLSRREVGAGQSKLYLDLAELPSEIEIKNGYVIASTRSQTVNTSIYNMDSYVNFQGKIVNSREQRPYVSSSGNTITLGAE